MKYIFSWESFHFLNSLTTLVEKPGPLKGKAKGLHSIRTGEYRVIIEIIDNKLMLLVIEAGPWKTIYCKYQS